MCGDVCLPGVASVGKMGYPKASKYVLSACVWAPKLLFFTIKEIKDLIKNPAFY